MQNKKTLILIPALAAVLAVLGCWKKETPKPVASNNNAQHVNQNTNTNSSANMNINTNTNIPDESEVAKNGGGEEIDTSDWQVYLVNNNFEFKHPIDWSIYSEKLNGFVPKVVANDEDGVVSEIGFFENKDNLEIEEWVDKNDFFKTKQYEDPEVFVDHSVAEPIEIISQQDGTIFKLYYGGGEGGLSFGTGITKINNKLIIFAYDLISYKGDLIKEKMEIFKNVIKSFHFLDNDDEEINISNWKTYRNDEYEFEFKYPNDWIYNDQQGEPDSNLLKWVYFFRQNPKDSKNFDRVEIKIYNTSDQEHLSDDFIKKEDFIRIKDAAKDNNGFIEEYGVVNINKRDFKKLIINYNEGSIKGYYSTFFKKKEYSINYVIYNYPEETKIIFEKMLSEFKFLE